MCVPSLVSKHVSDSYVLRELVCCVCACVFKLVCLKISSTANSIFHQAEVVEEEGEEEEE